MGILAVIAIFITYFVFRANGADMGSAGLGIVAVFGGMFLVYVVYRLIEDRP